MTESPLSRLVRALLLGGAAIVLLALVAVAAGGYRLGGSGSSGGQASPYAIDTLITVALAVYAIGVVAVIAGVFFAGLEVRRGAEAKKGRRATSLLTVILVLTALVVVASGHFHFRLHPFSQDQSSQSGGSQGIQPKGGDANRKAHDPQFRLFPFVLVVGGVGAGAIALFLAERRRRQRLPSEPAVADELAGALEVTLEDLRAEKDPRRAVIAAYARMERALAAHGIPRRRFEAPHEYLARVLDDLTHGGRGAKELTALFERARFSNHEIGPPLKDEAIAAVEGLQAELATAQLERVA